jgi:hypothetical protein
MTVTVHNCDLRLCPQAIQQTVLQRCDVLFDAVYLGLNKLKEAKTRSELCC